MKADCPIRELACDRNIYIINEEQLKEYIQEQDSCIIYEWMAYCSCYTPRLFERYCDSTGYKPIIILSSFCP
ncbi:MAG: hypothetical protein Q4B93_05485, partial [Clostridia bacterium]|nr:hypothetical protein [Clostridia bacterium]